MYLKFLFIRLAIFSSILFCFSLTITAQDKSELRFYLAKATAKEKLEYSWELFKAYRISNRDSALYFATLNNDLSKSLGDTLSMVRSYNAIGYVLREQGEFNNAIEAYEKGLELAEASPYPDQVKFLLNNLAIVNTYLGKYDKSLEYHFRSLKAREEEGNILEMSVSYNNIGLVYYKIEDHEKALKYFTQSLELKRKNEIDYDIERNLINIGLAYIGLKRYEKALEAFLELQERCGAECEGDIPIEMYPSLAYAHFEMGNYDEAKESYVKALAYAKEANDEVREVISLYHLAYIDYYKEDYADALTKLEQASSIAENTDDIEWVMNITNLYALLHEKLDNYKLAYEFKTRSSALKDSLLSNEVIKNLANIQLDFQEQQTQELIATKDFEIVRRTQINWLFGIITVLISTLLIILFRNIQLKKKANAQLAEANDIIEHQNKELTNVNIVLEERVKERTKELKETNEALRKSNEELDNFIYKTSHDIRGPLATLMGVCNVAQIDVKDEQALDYFQKLSITASKLNEILSKLLIINHINNTEIKKVPVNMSSLISELLTDNNLSNTNDDVKVIIKGDRNLTCSADEELLKVVAANIIDNAFKFHNPSSRIDSFIEIRTEIIKGIFTLVVVDNGLGIDKHVEERIFEIFSKATDMNDSAGLGLYLVKLSLEKLNGTISHSRTDEGYTKFEVKIPC